MQRFGGMAILLSAAVGLAVSVYNYLMPVGFLAPLSDIAGTPGAALVMFSSCALILAGLILAGSGRRTGLVRLMIVLSLLGILGTALAAYMLDSPVLLAMMAVALVGWLLRVFASGSQPA